MENKLEIKYRNQKQSFEILEDSLFVYLNTLNHKLEYKIPFEEIKNEIFTTRVKGDKKESFLYVSLFFNLIFALYILFDNKIIDQFYLSSLLFPLTMIVTFACNEINKGFEEKHIESSKILFFILTKKNKIEVDNFIELLLKIETPILKRNTS